MLATVNLPLLCSVDIPFSCRSILGYCLAGTEAVKIIRVPVLWCLFFEFCRTVKYPVLLSLLLLSANFIRIANSSANSGNVSCYTCAPCPSPPTNDSSYSMPSLRIQRINDFSSVSTEPLRLSAWMPSLRCSLRWWALTSVAILVV